MSIQQVIADKSTTVVAAGAVSINWWLPWLKSFSEYAALLVPIAGLLWLVIQISLKLRNHFGGKE